nr:glycosyltransferase [Pyrinomonadaceae bacterium]
MDKISVVTIALHGSPLLDESLSALAKQQGDGDAEIIVVSCPQNAPAEHVKMKFSRVKFLQSSERLGIPQLRALGISHATGQIIVTTEDCCIPDENWLKEIAKAHQSGYEVVGGAIENASRDRLVNWAVYLCEYSQMM